MNGNGLRSFTFHAEDTIDNTSKSNKYYDIEQLATALKKVDLAVPKANKEWKSAFHEIEKLLKELLLFKPLSGLVRGFKQDPRPVSFMLHNPNIKNSEFECVGTQEIRLTHTQLLKCRQKYNDIPVYGAQVTVEVDDDNELLSINSMIADSIDTVSHEPKIKQKKEIKAAIWKQTGHDLTDISIIPTLYYYFDSKEQKWRLVYLVEKKLNRTDTPVKLELIPEMVDYLVDAHTGDWVSQLPRVKTLKKL